MKKFILLFFLLLFCCSSSILGQSVAFQEDFESPPYQIQTDSFSGTLHKYWVIDSVFSCSKNSGSNYFNGFLQPQAPGGASGFTQMQTNFFSTKDSMNVNLTFSHICRIGIFNAGRLEITVDSGATWIPISMLNTNYAGSALSFLHRNSTLRTDTFNTLSYQAAANSIVDWSPTLATDTSMWVEECFDISQLAADKRNVAIRWKSWDLSQGFSSRKDGWIVDDIKVEFVFTKPNATSIETLSKSPSAHDVFYPNPANEFIYLKRDFLAANNFDVTIYDMLGNVCQKLGPSASAESIDVSNLAKGPYMLRISDGKKDYRYKWIKY